MFECDGFRVFSALIMNDSDIGFTFKLSKLLSNFDYCNWLMIGSCGIDVDPNAQSSFESLFECFWVRQASKFDRGELTTVVTVDQEEKESVVTVFNERKTKTLDITHVKTLPTCGQVDDVKCCNSLCLMSNFDRKKYDMESYEFIKMCELTDANCVGVIRIITDITGAKDNKILRTCSSFEELRELLCRNAFLFEELDVKGLKRNHINTVSNLTQYFHDELKNIKSEKLVKLIDIDKIVNGRFKVKVTDFDDLSIEETFVLKLILNYQKIYNLKSNKKAKRG